MTTPTQAQIEAALMAYSEKITEIIDRKGCLGLHDRHDAMVAALTAAAEVGPSETTLIHTVADAIENAALARLEEATIERCAKEVPTNWCDPLLTGEDTPKLPLDERGVEALLRGIQDRIRALKDKP